MQNEKKYLALFILVILSQMLTGCLRSYFPLYSQASATPVIFEPEQPVHDQEKYISADILFADGMHKNEALQMLRASYFVVDTRDYVNINGRLFGYYGNYNVSGMGDANGSKNAYGIGGEINLNVNLKIHQFKIGVGTAFGAATEFGSYYTFRKNGDNKNELYSQQDWTFLTISVFPVIAYESPEHNVLSFQVNTGVPGFYSPTVVWNRHGIVYWLSFLTAGDERPYYTRTMFGISKKL